MEFSVFEFGAVLYLASVFPGTLLPMSAYAFVRGFSAIVFASAIGAYIDSGDRLQVVRLSIGESLHLTSLIVTVGQRTVVAASCAIFYLLAIGFPLGSHGDTTMLVLLSLLACVEKVCSIINLVSVEKDWVSRLGWSIGL